MNRLFEKWACHLVSRYVALLFYRKTFLTYIHKNGVLWGWFGKRFTAYLQIRTIEKTSSIYTHQNGVLSPLLRVMFTVCLQKPISSIVLSLNSHRKMKTAPLLKNIPHLYEKNRGFGTPFWWLLVRYLQFIYKNWPSNGICAIGLSEIQWVTIKTSKWGLSPWLKIAPHLIGQKMGKCTPHSTLFTFYLQKSTVANKKCTFRRKVKVVWDVLTQPS